MLVPAPWPHGPVSPHPPAARLTWKAILTAYLGGSESSGGGGRVWVPDHLAPGPSPFLDLGPW